MSRTVSILGCLFTLAACSKEPSADQKVAPVAADKAEPSAKSADPAAPADDSAGTDKAAELPTVDGQFDCAKLLPAELVARHFPKGVVTKSQASSGSLTVCSVKQGELGEEGSISFTIAYDCSHPASMMKSMLDIMSGVPVEGLGRGAEADEHRLRAFDDDTACALSVSIYEPSQKAFVHDALEVLTPALISAAVVAK